jgi:hypothetical protein
MRFPISEYGRLDAESKHAVEQWVSHHLGDYHDVKDCGIDGSTAWFQRLLRNAEGNRYFADEDRTTVATEIVRVPLKRPFPTGLRRVMVDID